MAVLRGRRATSGGVTLSANHSAACNRTFSRLARPEADRPPPSGSDTSYLRSSPASQPCHNDTGNPQLIKILTIQFLYPHTR